MYEYVSSIYMEKNIPWLKNHDTGFNDAHYLAFWQWGTS